MRILLNACTIALAILASGCASVTGGNVQTMVVSTAAKDGKDVAGADCTLSNNKGSWRVKTPGETTIVRSNMAMTVKCEKEPLPAGIATVESATRGAMYGNILVGGIIGAAIDHSSGAAYEYPISVRVVMGDIVSIAPPKTQTETTANGRNVPKVHDKQFDLPPATGFANAADVNAVPSEQARKAYEEWLKKPVPRAFVLSSDGRPFWWSNNSAAVQKAMDRCNERAGGCHLYAYDDTVVWKASYVIEPRIRKQAQDKPQLAQAAGTESEGTDTVAYTSQSAPEKRAESASAPAPVLTHRNPVPAPTGFAAINDVNAVPLVGPKGRDLYREYLGWPTPKAMAISQKGAVARARNSADAMKLAVDNCEKYGSPCKLYAVDNNVVWLAGPRAANAAVAATAGAAQPAIVAASEEPKEHMFAKPAPSGFASATDSNAIPYLSTRGREGFVRYLASKSPKAFAIGADGSWNYMTNDPRAMKTALERCEARGATCWLYAVDNEIVWREEAAGRVRIPQLSSR